MPDEDALFMIPATRERIQGIRRFIEVTGAANVGWTEAGHIEGNDPHNGSNAFTSYTFVCRYPVRMDRFYVPSWVEEERQMYASLDETRASVTLAREEELKIDRMVADAHRSPEENPVPLDIFELEWDTDALLESTRVLLDKIHDLKQRS